MKDPNLARYLQHGRRHTLGAAHNHTILAPDQLRKLRDISEVSSSQTSDALDGGSISGGPQGSGSVAPVIISGSSNLQASLTLSSSGVHNSSQNSIPGFNIPNRPYLHVPRNKFGRRLSDAAPYAAAYRLFIEKRNPLLAANNGSMSMERQDSMASRSSTSSVKMLLQEKKAFGEAYGVLPTTHHKQWMQYKNQVIGLIITNMILIFYLASTVTGTHSHTCMYMPSVSVWQLVVELYMLIPYCGRELLVGVGEFLSIRHA